MRFDPRRLLSLRNLLGLVGLGLWVDAIIRFRLRGVFLSLPLPNVPASFEKFIGSMLVFLWWWLGQSEEDSKSDSEDRHRF